MVGYDPEQFWSRFRTLTVRSPRHPPNRHQTIHSFHLAHCKDLSRADDAVKIAAAFSTTVEYLVTGSSKALSPSTQEPAYAEEALEIALTAAKLSPEGLKTLRYVAKGLLTQLPKTPE